MALLRWNVPGQVAVVRVFVASGATVAVLTIRRLAAMAALLLTVALVAPGVGRADSAAVAGNGELQPIQAEQARPAFVPSPATDIHYGGRTRSAMAYLVSVDAPAAHAASNSDETTVVAYSLDLQAGPAGAGAWSAVEPDIEGIAGMRSASSIAAAGSNSDLADTARELAARQIAIWHYTNGLAITRATVPDRLVRARARTLSAQAVSGKAPPAGNPISVGVAAGLADVGLRRITIGVLLSINGENSYCTPQKLDVRINGHWGVATTGAVTTLNYAGPKHLAATRAGALSGAPCGKGPARDFNQARFTLPRPQVGTDLEIDWNITLSGLNVFENGSAPPLLVVGGKQPNLEFRQVLPLDPSSFPTAHSYLEQFLTTIISKFHGIWAIVVLIVLLAVAPMVSEGARALVLGTGRFIARRASPKRDSGERSGSGSPAPHPQPRDASPELVVRRRRHDEQDEQGDPGERQGAGADRSLGSEPAAPGRGQPDGSRR